MKHDKIDSTTTLKALPAAALAAASIITAATALAGGSASSHANAAHWRERYELTASEPTGMDYFGSEVALSGNRAVVGAPFDVATHSGAGYVFETDGGVVEQDKIVASDAEPEDWFGLAVAVSGDTVLVGAPLGDDGGTDAGAAYVFIRDGDGWIEQQKLTASDASPGAWFGLSVTLDGDTAIIGADRDDAAGSYSGAAYVFVRDGDSWVEQQKLTAADSSSADMFGFSVAMSDDRAIIGAPGADGAASGSGAAYVFVREADGWVQEQKLVTSDLAAMEVGVSVALHGDTAVVGAPNSGYYLNGAAYVFDRADAGWSEQQKLSASDSAEEDRFGVSVAIRGNHVLVGAYEDDEAGFGSGSVYAFTRNPAGTWLETDCLVGSDTAAGDNFGTSVAMSKHGALVGAYRSGGTTGSGSSYLFTLDRSAPVWLQQR